MSTEELTESGYDLASPPQPLPNSSPETAGRKKSPGERARERKEQGRDFLASGGKVTRQKSKAKPPKEPKLPLGVGFLKNAFSKASWGISLAKAFAPKLELNARNRVKVGVRFRPLNESEKKRGDADKLTGGPGKSWLDLEEAVAQVTITNPKPPVGQEPKTDYYAFDNLYGPDTTTKQVFEDLCVPLLGGLFGGYNGTIFAYGQTGSGKTHSIMGYDKDPGVVPRCCEALMQMMAELDPDSGSAVVKASYLQIYREVLHDLLSSTSLDQAHAADRDHKKDLKIRRGKDGIYVENLVEVPLKTSAELTNLIEQGNKKRATSATLMNAASSRSHAVVILSLERHEKASAVKAAYDLTSKLHLVDLAGSERVYKSGASGESLKEAIAINQSLSMLGTVINALTDGKGQSHIPYRSSKLTFLLEDSLGGNSHTVMLAAASPSARSYFETLSTLQYAARAKLIVCDPKANVVGGETTVSAEELARLQDENKEQGPKVWDHLPRWMRTHQAHAPRRTWKTGEEQREDTIAKANAGFESPIIPPRRV